MDLPGPLCLCIPLCHLIPVSPSVTILVLPALSLSRAPLYCTCHFLLLNVPFMVRRGDRNQWQGVGGRSYSRGAGMAAGTQAVVHLWTSLPYFGLKPLQGCLPLLQEYLNLKYIKSLVVNLYGRHASKLTPWPQTSWVPHWFSFPVEPATPFSVPCPALLAQPAALLSASSPISHHTACLLGLPHAKEAVTCGMCAAGRPPLFQAAHN